MHTHRIVALLLTVFLVCGGAVCSAEFADHPQIGRYQGSTVIHQESSRLNEYTLGLGVARDGKVSPTQKVTGTVTMTLYSGPENASSFEVISAYRKLLESRGFQVLFSCEKAECGEKYLAAFYDLAPFASDYGWNHSAPITQGNGEFSYVLVARSAGGGPLTYVSLIVSQGWWRYPVYKLDVVEVRDQSGGISSVAGEGRLPGAPSAGEEGGPVVRRPLQLGLQASSDGSFGPLLLADRFEVCAKVQAVLYDGFPGDVKPDNDMLMVGGHVAYLFRPSQRVDVSVGADVRQGITLRGDIVYEQHIDAGLRIAMNYRLGDRFMLSGVVCPVWLVVRETDVNDSYNMTVTAPRASVAVSVLF